MRVEIKKLDHFGRGICKVNGKICFVLNALPLENVEIKVVKNLKKYQEAEVVEFISKSKDRIEVSCPYYSVCGGCNLLHLSTSAENEYKREKVLDLLKRYGKIDNCNLEGIFSSQDKFYRNKVVLHGDGKRLGFYKDKTNEVIEIKKCLISSLKINEVISKLNDLEINSSIDECIIRVSNCDSKVMLKLTGNNIDISRIKDFVDVLIVNDKLISKDDRIISTIGSRRYYVSIDSFFQVNRFLTEKLYDEVLRNVKILAPLKVLDLYCGTGTIGIYVSDYASLVIGVDSSKSGIEDANLNKKLNNVKNIKFICSKVEDVIDTFLDDIDLVIIDPPRSGLDKKTIANLIRINPLNIIYISCDPVTLARDLNYLSNNYVVDRMKCFNMFPNTYHVESMCLLCRKENQKAQ